MTREQEYLIVQRVLEGDTNAFEELVLEYEKKVYNVALRMLNNSEDAADMTQEAFIKAYNSLSGFRGDSTGDIIATSYRDPTPGKTLGHFDDCAKVVKALCAPGTDLTRYILGAMADADPLLGAAGKIRLAETRHFRGTGTEEVRLRRRQLLECKAEDLLALCPALEQIAQKENYCIIAGKQQLDDCAGLLDTVLENLD